MELTREAAIKTYAKTVLNGTAKYAEAQSVTEEEDNYKVNFSNGVILQIPKKLTRKELRAELTSYARRSLVQRQRQLNKKWAKGLITTEEMLMTEATWYDDIAKRVEKYA